MSYSFWDGLGDVLTAGGYSSAKKLYSFVTGSKNDNLIDTALNGLNLSIENILDPGNLLWSSEQQKLAEDQFAYEKRWNEANFYEQKRQYEKNYAAELEAYNYQKSLNALQMEREDTAVQRRVADLQAAGLSPTLAAGSSASSTPVHAGTAPHMEPAQMQTASDIKVQAAMFKEQMMKERMGLAMSLMSNMADVSRTKAETEFINAQKDRYVAETPIDLRLKEIEQQISDSTLKYQIKQQVQETEINELRKINTGLSNMLLEKENGIKAYEVVTKSEEAKQAPQYFQSRTEKLQQEVVDKTIANEMADFLNETSKDIGVPHEMMSPSFKNINSWRLYGEKSAKDVAKYKSDVVDETSGYVSAVKKWFSNFKNWRSPSLLYR